VSGLVTTPGGRLRVGPMCDAYHLQPMNIYKYVRRHMRDS